LSQTKSPATRNRDQRSPETYMHPLSITNMFLTLNIASYRFEDSQAHSERGKEHEYRKKQTSNTRSLHARIKELASGQTLFLHNRSLPQHIEVSLPLNATPVYHQSAHNSKDDTVVWKRTRQRGRSGAPAPHTADLINHHQSPSKAITAPRFCGGRQRKNPSPTKRF